LRGAPRSENCETPAEKTDYTNFKDSVTDIDRLIAAQTNAVEPPSPRQTLRNRGPNCCGAPLVHFSWSGLGLARSGRSRCDGAVAEFKVPLTA
jgi:hypothetical protein